MQDFDAIRNRELDRYLTKYDPVYDKYTEKHKAWARDDAIENALSDFDSVFTVMESAEWKEMYSRIAAIMTCDRDSVPEHIDAMREISIRVLADKIEAKTDELLRSGMY